MFRKDMCFSTLVTIAMASSGAGCDLASICYVVMICYVYIYFGLFFLMHLFVCHLILTTKYSFKILNDAFRATKCTVTNEYPCWTAVKYCMSKFP